MKTYTCPAGRVSELQHEHPERTAYRNASGPMNFDVVFQVWPNRPAMARSIRMQERAGTRNPWRAVVKLGTGEGH